MGDTSFRFKNFTVHQDKCAMKVGTDSVLLGSWINPGNAKDILDIGTGTGIIALMVAQKSVAEIDAIDIDQNAYLQSRENFLISPWFFRLHSHHFSFQEFSELKKKTYDLIISNPPYFHHASKPQKEERIQARHHDALTFDELISGVKNLLKPEGRFVVILPCKEGMEFMDKAQKNGLFCNQLIRVKTKADRSEKRLIMQFSSDFGLLKEDEIIVHDEEGNFTGQYIDLTIDYYINLKPTPSAFPQN